MTKSRPLPEQALLQRLLSYDPDTGRLVWKSRPIEMFADERSSKSFHTKYAGNDALTAVTKAGYKNGTLLCEVHLAHRVIWKLMTGEDPVSIDHINGDRADNRWCNLRNVSQGDNCRNQVRSKRNRTGTTGVFFDEESQKWLASIRANGRSKNLGRHASKDKAVAVRKAAERKYGYHPNHGRAS